MAASSHRVLLTGATGFVGSHLARLLRAQGHQVMAPLRPGSAVPTDLANGIEWLAVSDSVGRIQEHPPTAVMHLATCYSAPTMAELLTANLLWPLQLLEAGLRAGCRLFIGADSFFARPGLDYPHMQDYIQSKRDLVRWADLASTGWPDSRRVNLRLEHVYGPGDRATKFVPQLISRLRRHDPVIDLTPGDQCRDFVYVVDVAQAFLAVLQAADRLPPGASEMAVGTGQAVTLRSFVETLARILGSRSDLNFGALPHRPGEIMASRADTQALAAIGWRPGTRLEDGLRQTLAQPA